MPNQIFHQNKGPFTLKEIVKIGELTLADPSKAEQTFTDVAGLDEATENDVSWAFIPSVREALKKTKAGAVIVPEKFASLVPAGTIALISQDAHRSYGLVAGMFYPHVVRAGISKKAIIDDSAQIGKNCEIGAGAVIGANVQLGEGCQIQPNAVIGDNVVLGKKCIVGSNATVTHCIAGNDVHIYPGAQIGQDGFGFAMSAKGPVKVPQLGIVRIGNNVEIGSNTTVDRGAMGDTVIADGTRIDNLVQVAHNVKLGHNNIIVAQVGIAGSCTFDDFVVAGGQVGFAGHLHVGMGAQIAAQSGIMSDIPAGAKLMGSPAMPIADYMRLQVSLKNLNKKKVGKPLSTWEKIKLFFLKSK